MRLGYDIGGTKAVAVLARAQGDVLAETRVEDWASGKASVDLERLIALGRALLREKGIAPEELRGVGISAPGPIDGAHGVVIYAPNLPGWRDVPVVETLRRAFQGAQVVLENDANAAALAEFRFGAGRGARSGIYLTMSTGVGAGLVFDGRLYRGATFQAGEVGHLPIEPGGRACACGLRGCLEAYTGGAALAARIGEDLESGVETRIRELAGHDPARVTARLWVEALRAGDAYAEGIRDEYLDRLSQGLAILIQALDPECVVLGTIVEQNADLFLAPLRERVRARTWPSLHGVRIVAAALGAALPTYAALCAAFPDA